VRGKPSELWLDGWPPPYRNDYKRASNHWRHNSASGTQLNAIMRDKSNL